MASSYALTVQQLGTGQDRVLVLGEFAGARNTDGWFGPSEVAALFEALRVRAPGNISQDLARLKRADLVVDRRARPSWSLTPAGRERIKSLVGRIDPGALAAELEDAPGAEIARVLHTVIPPSLAPVQWQGPIQRLLMDHEFSTNVFCMTRFPSNASDAKYLDPIRDILDVAKDVMRMHSLTLHIASDRQLDDDLYRNIAAYMWACQYGIGLFENRLGHGLNQNLLIEVGSMIATARRGALLKDGSASMPTDFVGQIYKNVDFDDLTAVSAALHGWAALDLTLGRCPACPN